MPVSHRVRYRFGNFEFDPDAQLLLENRNPLHATAQTLRLLELLVANAGRLVTRQQLQRELWPEGVHVDFERGIRSAVRRLRQLLGDDDEDPRYIATLTGQGYRFIASVERVDAEASEPNSTAGRPKRRWLPAVGMAALAALGVAGWASARPRLPPEVMRVRALTTDGGLDLMARPASHEALIYYLDRAGGHWNLMSSNGDPTSATAVATPFGNARLFAIARGGTVWLLGSFRERGEEAKLWRQTRPGGAPVRLGSLQAYDAVWDPDGRHIEYSSGDALWKAAADGSNPRRLAASLPGDPDWMSWSPDGKQLRFSAGSELWEWRPGEAVRALPFRLPRCCGAWSGDGRYFFFSAKENGRWTLWAQRINVSWLPRLVPGLRPAPLQLLSLPQDSFGAYTAFGHNQVEFYERQPQPDPERCGARLTRCQTLLAGRDALEVSFSADGKRLVYLDGRDSSIWSADVGPDMGAGNFRRLSPAGVVATSPQWSRNGQTIAYASQAPGGRSRLWRVAADGGPSVPLAPGESADTALYSPGWSPDGRRLAAEAETGDQERIVILGGKQPRTLPGSNGLYTPRWSPDGRWLSAISEDQTRVSVYDFTRQRWRVVAYGHAFLDPRWSSDGRYLYFQDLLADGEPLYRAEAGIWKSEKVADFTPLLHDGAHRCAFMGLAPDGELLIALNGSSADLYAATLDLP